MKTIKIIYDKDIGSNIPSPETYGERRATRALVFDQERRMALLHATNKGYHKLPGGGIEDGEDMFEALRRECLEEIGCNIGNIRELGIIEEYRNGFKLHQVSYCYIADLVGEQGQNKLEEDEAADGFEPEWMKLEDAIKILESEAGIEHYEIRFMRLRDLTFLKAAR